MHTMKYVPGTTKGDLGGAQTVTLKRSEFPADNTQPQGQRKLFLKNGFPQHDIQVDGRMVQ